MAPTAFRYNCCTIRASAGSGVKNLPVTQETQIQSLRKAWHLLQSSCLGNPEGQRESQAMSMGFAEWDSDLWCPTINSQHQLIFPGVRVGVLIRIGWAATSSSQSVAPKAWQKDELSQANFHSQKFRENKRKKQLEVVVEIKDMKSKDMNPHKTRYRKSITINTYTYIYNYT